MLEDCNEEMCVELEGSRQSRPLPFCTRLFDFPNRLDQGGNDRSEARIAGVPYFLAQRSLGVPFRQPDTERLTLKQKIVNDGGLIDFLDSKERRTSPWCVAMRGAEAKLNEPSNSTSIFRAAK
jgi:hypothetical protein